MYEESLNYKNKPLRELTLEESMEYEKEVLKKILLADKAGMTAGLIAQMNSILAIIQSHKAEKINQEIVEINKKSNTQEKQSDEGLLIGENKQESSDSDD